MVALNKGSTTAPMKIAPMPVPSLAATLAMLAAATLPPAPGMFETMKLGAPGRCLLMWRLMSRAYKS